MVDCPVISFDMSRPLKCHSLKNLEFTKNYHIEKNELAKCYWRKRS